MKQKVEIMSMTDEILSPITKASNVLLEDGSNVQQLIDNYVEPEFTPTIETSSSMSKVGQGDNVDFSANVINGAYESCVLKGKTLVNYNAEGNDRNEYVCMPSVEGQHITATDTIEGHAKSAILKGNTLVNLTQPSLRVWTMNLNSDTASLKATTDEFIIDWSKGVPFNAWIQARNDNSPVFGGMIKPNTDYTFIIRILENNPTFEGVTVTGNVANLQMWGLRGYHAKSFSLQAGVTGTIALKYNFNTLATATQDNENIFGIAVHGTASNGTKTIDGGKLRISKDVIVLEGDYTNNYQYIPYFEGMQSVKLPVLTTTGKNLFDGEFDLTITSTHAWSKNFIRVMPNTAYIFSHQGTDSVRKVDRTEYYNEKFELIGYQGIGNSVTTPNDCHYIKFRYHLMDQDLSKVENTQLEQGTQATSYEPYKSNILSCNEEVILRSLPNGVCDTLNLNTGEYVQRIGEVLLTEQSYTFGGANAETNTSLVAYNVANSATNTNNTGLPNDRLPSVHGNYQIGKLGVSQNNDGRIFAVIPAIFSTVSEWLAQNPITVQYQLATPTVKTVDLSDNHVYSYKDVTHYDCSSAEGSLVPTLSIEEGVKYQAIIKPSTKYSIVFNRTVASDSLTVDLGGATANVVSTTIGKTIVQITTLPTLSHNYVKFLGVGNAVKDVQVIEGDVTGEEPYFEGMIDVENPVVTNTGKNLVGSYKKIVYRSGRNQYGANLTSEGNFAYGGADSGNRPTLIYKVKSNDNIVISSSESLQGVAFYEYNDEPTFAKEDEPTLINEYLYTGTQLSLYRTMSSNTKYLGISFYADSSRKSIDKLQIEQGTQATIYEPYKSNTITTEQSDGSIITLRKVGDVCDTLDLMSGEYVQRVGVRAYQEGDESNSQVSTDKVNTQYQLETPITTTIDLKQHPYAYKDGYINLSSNSENSLAPSIEYSLPINRSGQVSINTQLVQKQQKQLDELESMIIANMVNTQYKQTLSNVEYMLGGE